MTDKTTPQQDMESQSRLDEAGREIPDPRSVRIPLGFKVPETLAQQVQRLVRNGLSIAAQQRGAETWEEADDFDIDDDPPDPLSPFEAFFEPALGRDVSAHELMTQRDHLVAQYERAIAARQAEEAFIPPPPQTPSSPSKEGPAKGAVSADAGGETPKLG